MQKSYNPHSIEQHWYNIWENAGYFAPNGKGDPYCIVIPPPNVTGSLHMGHGFQLSLMDALVRYHRMLGFNTLWQVGTDHAGIATQMVVEQQLAKEGLSRSDLGRDEFIKRIWEWKKQSGDTIGKQERRLGISADWSRERFTLDDSLNKAVKHVFVDLYHNKGLIYRGKRLVNWDPILMTAISDLEVTHEEQMGNLWYIRYHVCNSNDDLIIATTRPETMFGDVAIAVHPDDERYKNFIGKFAEIPISKKPVLIIADDSVDKEFGTGCVKITPAHDFNDCAAAERYNKNNPDTPLSFINIFTKTAQLNDSDHVPKEYQSLDRFEARKLIINELQANGLLTKIEPHKLKIPKSERSGTVIEPYLTEQWFMKTKELAKRSIDAVKKGKIKFTPENWSKTYFQWLDNIEDWCISRQLWWGHRIPAWYDQNGNPFVGTDIEDICKRYNFSKEDIKKFGLTQDDDVLDTWFSSALWPFSSLGWENPENITPEFKTFYPTNVLVTGFDIIFFWVARMVMMGLEFTNNVPFNEAYIHGLIRDSKGQKMSKSKGNVIDPLDLIDGITLDELIKKRTSFLMQPSFAKKIEKNTREEFPDGISAFGSDAVRFTFCALASTGRDINFDLARLEGYRNFCNKIWNAARFVLMQLDDFEFDTHEIELNTADRWIKTELHNTIKSVKENFKIYRFDLIAQSIYEFVWHNYCDWYLELCKPILGDKNSTISFAQKNAARKTLLEVLEAVLRLIHPLMPFISEELWQNISPKIGITAKTIMLQPYPKAEDMPFDESALQEISWLKKIVNTVRNIRGENSIDPKAITPKIWFKKGTAEEKKLTRDINTLLLLNLAKIKELGGLVADGFTLPICASQVIENGELEIYVEIQIDKEAELVRLNKESTKLQQTVEQLQQKLSNSSFTEKAPENIVTKEKQRLAQAQKALEKMEQMKSSLIKSSV